MAGRRYSQERFVSVRGALEDERLDQCFVHAREQARVSRKNFWRGAHKVVYNLGRGDLDHRIDTRARSRGGRCLLYRWRAQFDSECGLQRFAAGWRNGISGVS